MAHFRLVCKTLRISSLRNELIKEKKDAAKIYQHQKIKLTLKQRCNHAFIDCRRNIKRCITCKKCPKVYRFCYRLRHDGSFENYLLKSIFGFISGFVLTYLFYFILVLHMGCSFTIATIICTFLGIILMLGLAFSTYVRCILLLLLPTICSKRGRQALLAYAFVLTLTGPARNYLNNMGILTESLACGQEQLKQAVRQILDVIKKPFYAIKDAIKTLVKTVKVVVKKIKEILIKIKRIIMAIVGVIKSAFQFLGKILNICNKELGTPFQRCAKVFDNAIVDCNAKLGPFFSWLCSITYLIKGVCYIVKIFDYVCMIVDFISNSIIGVVFKKIKAFVRHIHTMFYVRIKFSHSYSFETKASKSLSDVAKAILDEVKERTLNLQRALGAFGALTSCFILVFVLRVMYYRYKYLTSDRFDNKYITKDFRLIDMVRAKLGRETILPLTRKEAKLYVTVGSLTLIKTEKKKLANAFVMLGVATLKIGCHILSDYCLYWIMNLIAYYGRFQSKVESPNLPTLHIEGQGLLADLLKAIVNAFKPVGIKLEIDTVPCLPHPIPPDFDRYIMIGFVLLLCWILTVVEPYCLRLRQKVMSYYYPLRAKQRAVWLYNQILRKRTSFLKFARRFLRRKVLNVKGETVPTCKEWIRSRLPCKIFDLCFGSMDIKQACILCGEVLRSKDPELKAKYCQTPGCQGVYCSLCFQELKNICTLCMSPIDYGDLSDISLEMGSEDDDERVYKPKRKLSQKIKEAKRDDEETEKLIEVTQLDEDEENLLRKLNADTEGENNFDYQFIKSPETSKTDAINEEATFRDVENGKIKDYASMDSFRMIKEETLADSDSEAFILEPIREKTVDKATNTSVKVSIATSVSGINLKKN